MTHKRALIIPADKGLDCAAEVIKDGGIIAYPTESSYALGVDPANPEAVKRLFCLKGRPESVAMPLIAGVMADVRNVTKEISALGNRLIKKFWPGPLTLIFEAADDIPRLLMGDKGGIGIRISAYPLCKMLTGALGGPLTSTSANSTGNPPALEAKEIEAYFSGRIELILDGGRLAEGPASTVVDVRGERPVILREGAVNTADILRALE